MPPAPQLSEVDVAEVRRLTAAHGDLSAAEAAALLAELMARQVNWASLVSSPLTCLFALSGPIAAVRFWRMTRPCTASVRPPQRVRCLSEARRPGLVGQTWAERCRRSVHRADALPFCPSAMTWPRVCANSTGLHRAATLAAGGHSERTVTRSSGNHRLLPLPSWQLEARSAREPSASTGLRHIRLSRPAFVLAEYC